MAGGRSTGRAMNEAICIPSGWAEQHFPQKIIENQIDSKYQHFPPGNNLKSDWFQTALMQVYKKWYNITRKALLDHGRIHRFQSSEELGKAGREKTTGVVWEKAISDGGEDVALENIWKSDI